MTSTDVCKRLGLTIDQLGIRLKRGIFPPPTMVSGHGVRYFDENWLRIARAIEENSYEAQRKQ